MSSLVDVRLESNSKLKFNFGGGDLYTDTRLFLLKEFIHKTHDSASFDIHKDTENLLQEIYQTIAGYFQDDADEFINDPVFKTILNKDALASQPTMSRFFNRIGNDTLNQYEQIHQVMRQRIYSIEVPNFVLLDIDSTLFDTYGNQEGQGFNYHYSSYGYHPLLCRIINFIILSRLFLSLDCR